MRHGPHHHPCALCLVDTECDGELRPNVDGWPETVCVEYHVDNRLDFLCELCDSQAVADALADELENV